MHTVDKILIQMAIQLAVEISALSDSGTPFRKSSIDLGQKSVNLIDNVGCNIFISVDNWINRTAVADKAMVSL